MTTKILESKVTISGKVYNVINTDSEISVDWDIALDKKDTSAIIVLKINSVFGNFNYSEQREGYQKKTTINFKSDDTWKVNASIRELNDYVILPIISKIDLDTKTIQIYF
jgi:hypothetical protein